MKRITLLLLGLLLLVSRPGFAEPVPLPAGIDHADWDRLLQTYVDEDGLVAYADWKKSEKDVEALRRYLAQFAPSPSPAAKGNERIASLINAYNAFTIHFILEHYPTESIRALKNPFKGKRHLIGGKMVSVAEIEHEALREMIGWKMHAVLVCAARSCPPLYRRAFRAEDWERIMEDRTSVWLGRKDLNQFDPDGNTVSLSKIFTWHAKDFRGKTRTHDVLLLHAPEEYKAFVAKDTYRINYLDYHWGLNDQSELGKDYKHSLFGF